MPAWEFSATDLLFPLAVVAVWAALFLGIFAFYRWAARDHDGAAESEERAVQEARGHSYPPLPA